MKKRFIFSSLLLALLISAWQWAPNQENESYWPVSSAEKEGVEQAVLDELAELQQQPVRAELPPISNSIAALQYFIDSRHGATETKP